MHNRGRTLYALAPLPLRVQYWPPCHRLVAALRAVIAATVGPAALFALGLSLIDRKLMGNAGEVIWLSTLKLIANPMRRLS